MVDSWRKVAQSEYPPPPSPSVWRVIILGSKLNVQIFFILSFETCLFVYNYFSIATSFACLFAIVVYPGITNNEDYFFFAFCEVNGVFLVL